MPPILAVLVFLGFSVYALRIHHRREPFPVSAGISLAIFWFLYSGSRTIGYWFDPGTDIEAGIDYVGGNPVDRAILTCVILVGIFILARRRISPGAVWNANRWILLLFLFMGVSILWSNFPMVSFKRWFRGTGDLVMVLLVLSEANPLQALQGLLRTGTYFLIPLSVLLIKYFRPIGVLDNVDGSAMWVGVTGHKNSLGQLAAIGTMFLLWSLFRRDLGRAPLLVRISDLLVLAMCLWLFSGPSSSLSTTSLTVLLFGSLVYALAMLPGTDLRRFKFFILCLIVPAILVQGILLLTADQSLYSLFLHSANKSETLTGRTDLWAALINIGNRHPFLGSGFGGFWIGDVGNNLWDDFGWGPEAAHNGYLDVYIDLGLAGLALLGGFLYVSLKRGFSLFDSEGDWGKLRLTLMAMILLYNVAESGFTKPNSYLWYLFLLLAVAPPPAEPAPPPFKGAGS
jgi:exopolysaccharide production protein ExoQ